MRLGCTLSKITFSGSATVYLFLHHNERTFVIKVVLGLPYCLPNPQSLQAEAERIEAQRQRNIKRAAERRAVCLC